MAAPLCNHRPDDRHRAGAGMLWLFAVAAILVLGLAGFVGTIF